MTVHDRAAETYKTLNDASRSHDECLREAVNAAIEACAKVIDDNQERMTSTGDGDIRSISPRMHGNLAGIAFAAAIRALSDGGQKND